MIMRRYYIEPQTVLTELGLVQGLCQLAGFGSDGNTMKDPSGNPPSSAPVRNTLIVK